jgi:hypothetical protein
MKKYRVSLRGKPAYATLKDGVLDKVVSGTPGDPKDVTQSLTPKERGRIQASAKVQAGLL